jgi:N-acetylneuraminic acid mutarotase
MKRTFVGMCVAALSAALLTAAPAVATAPGCNGVRDASTLVPLAQASDPAQWVAQPPLRVGRAGLTATTVNGQILAIGGFDGGGVFDVVEARSVSEPGVWHDLAPLATRRANSAAATVGGLVYVAGGYGNGVGNILKSVEKYDPATGAWGASEPLPQPRGGPGAAAWGGRLYVAGGIRAFTAGASDVLRSMVVYDPSTGRWTQAAPMSTPREKFRLVAAGPYLYAIGGTATEQESLASVERYDPRTDTWRTMTPMHESRAVPGVTAATVGNRDVLVVVAGVERAGGINIGGRRTTEVYDIGTGKWKLLDVLLPTNLASNESAVTASGAILSIAGVTSIDFLRDVNAIALTPSDLQ